MPNYIAESMQVCEFLGINAHVSAEEAVPQISYESLKKGWVPVTVNSDIIAYGTPGEVIIVKSFMHEWFGVVDVSRQMWRMGSIL